MTLPYSSIGDREMFDIPAQEKSDRHRLVERPVASVILITYNHEPFVSEAIDSVLKQKTPFPCEVLIGEDRSADNTLEICRAYQKEFPDRVRLITSEQNVGMHRNIARLWCRCRGKYVAFCEGDDYWCDDRKLAKQVEFLDRNPAFSMCGAYTDRIKWEPGTGWRVFGRLGPAQTKRAYGVADLIPLYNFHTSSIVLRKAMIRFPSWFWQVYCADRPLYILCAEKGPVGFVPECMSVYRSHEGGVWSPRQRADKARKSIQLFEHLDEHLRFGYHRLIRKTLGRMIWSYAAESLLAGDLRTGRRLLAVSLGYSLPFLPAPPTMLIKAFIRLYLPFLRTF